MSGAARPRIALTMRVTHAAGYAEPRDSISHDWLRRLIAWDMTPLPVPNLLDDPTSWLAAAGAQLIVLTGGDDPGEPHERHVAETRILDHALARDIPVLGVCRGLQVLNLRFGGRLRAIEGHVATAHDVDVTQAFRGIYGAHARVNSFHNLGIGPEGLGRDLAAFASDADGGIEAAHHLSRPLVGLMWHPERAGAPTGDAGLVRALIERGAFWR